MVGLPRVIAVWATGWLACALARGDDHVELSPLRELLEHASDVLRGAALLPDAAFVPVFDFALARASSGGERVQHIRRLQSLFERNVPFILRGTGAPTAAWSADYLRTHMHDSEEAARIALHAFVGDTYKYGSPSNARTQFAPGGAHAAAWWRMWDAGVCVQSAADVHMDMAAAGWGSDAAAALERQAVANASRMQCPFSSPPSAHRRTYLQVTNGERAFVEDDTELLFGLWRLPPCATNRTGGDTGVTACRDDVQDVLVRGSSVNAHTPVECRFGYRGTRVEAHFDTYDNLVMLGTGERLYVLAPPEECNKLSVSRTPSRLRHSIVDWTSRRVWRSHPFRTARGVAVKLSAGDVLRIPPFWFHFIVSLTATAQCSKMIAKSVYPLSIMQCLARNASRRVASDDMVRGQVTTPLLDSVAQVLMQDPTSVRMLREDAAVRFMDAVVAPGVQWRDAPWMQPGLTPFSDTARGRSDSGMLSTWYSVQDAVAALGSDTSVPEYLVQEAGRWAPILTASDLQRTCSHLQREQLDGLVMLMQLPAPRVACDEASHAVSHAEVRVYCDHAGDGARRMSVHFQGSIMFCPESLKLDASARRSSRTGSILATLTDISAAREAVVYEYEEVPTHDHAHAVDDEVREGGSLRLIVTMYNFPSLRGVFGIAMRIRGNIAGFAQERLVPPIVYNILLMMLAGPLLLPCACCLWLCVRFCPPSQARSSSRRRDDDGDTVATVMHTRVENDDTQRADAMQSAASDVASAADSPAAEGYGLRRRIYATT